MTGGPYQRPSRAEIAARVHAEEAVVPVDAREELEAAIWRHWPTRGPEAGKAVDAILAAAERYATTVTGEVLDRIERDRPHRREDAMIPGILIAALLIAAYLAAVIRFAALVARRLERNAPPAPDALAVICDPCSGRGGTWCKCAAKCISPACGAADTGIGGWSREEMAYLRGERGDLPR